MGIKYLIVCIPHKVNGSHNTNYMMSLLLCNSFHHLVHLRSAVRAGLPLLKERLSAETTVRIRNTPNGSIRRRILFKIPMPVFYSLCISAEEVPPYPLAMPGAVVGFVLSARFIILTLLALNHLVNLYLIDRAFIPFSIFAVHYIVNRLLCISSFRHLVYLNSLLLLFPLRPESL